jgi:hypothetical protein
MNKFVSWLASQITAGLFFKGLAYAWSVLNVLQTDPPSSTQMDEPCVKSVPCGQWQFWWGVFTSVCRTLLQYTAEIRKNFAALLVELPRFRSFLSHLSVVRQDACCFCLTSCCKYALFSFCLTSYCKYALFSFFIWREKEYQTGKKLTL